MVDAYPETVSFPQTMVFVRRTQRKPPKTSVGGSYEIVGGTEGQFQVFLVGCRRVRMSSHSSWRMQVVCLG